MSYGNDDEVLDNQTDSSEQEDPRKAMLRQILLDAVQRRGGPPAIMGAGRINPGLSSDDPRAAMSEVPPVPTDKDVPAEIAKAGAGPSVVRRPQIASPNQSATATAIQGIKPVDVSQNDSQQEQQRGMLLNRTNAALQEEQRLQSSKPGWSGTHIDKDTGQPVKNIQNPFLRTIAGIGDTALQLGGAAFPGIRNLAPIIPGTTAHHNALLAGATNAADEGLAQEKSEAATAKDIADAGPKVDTGKTPEEKVYYDLTHPGPDGLPRINPATKQPYTSLEAAHAAKTATSEEAWSVVPGVLGPNGGLIQEEKHSGNRREITDLGPVKPIKTPGDTAIENKEKFQNALGKLADEGLLKAGDVTNNKKISDALAKSKTLTPQEKSAVVGYLGANTTPGTSVTIHNTEKASDNAVKDAKQWYGYKDESGQDHYAKGDKVPPGALSWPIKDPQTLVTEAENTDIIQKSFSKLTRDDLSIFDNGAARAIIATATSDEAAHSMGLLVAGTGGSVSMPAGAGKIIDQLLENHAPGMDDKTKRAVKDYLADYWAMKDKLLMTQMAMQNGKMGRGGKGMIDAMFAQLPGGGTSDSTMARRQLGDLNDTLTGLRGRYSGLTKEPDLNPQDISGSKPPAGATMKVPGSDNKMHWSNDKKQDLGVVE